MPATCRVKCTSSNFISRLTEVVLAEGVVYHLVTFREKIYVDRECKLLSWPEGRVSNQTRWKDASVICPIQFGLRLDLTIIITTITRHILSIFLLFYLYFDTLITTNVLCFHSVLHTKIYQNLNYFNII